jgi:adenylate cyclase
MASLVERRVYRFGGFVLDCSREVLRTADGRPVLLRPKSFALLLLLIENAGQVMTRSTIMEKLWPNLFVTDDSITQCVLDVRRALGVEAQHLLKTVARRGYVFEPDAIRQEPTSPAPAPRHAAGSLRPRPLSVLVLPVTCFDLSETNQRLAGALTDDIVTDLTRRLHTFAPGETQVVFNDDRLADLRTSPHEDPDYLLRASVPGNRPTSLTLQLIHFASGVCVWADRCDRLDYHGAIDRMVHECCLSLVHDAVRRIEALPTQALTVHDLLLQGHAWLLRPYSSTTRRRALICFEQAFAMDPDSVGARLGIAGQVVAALANGWSHTIEQDEARSEALVLGAMQAGGDLARAHYIYGTLRRLQGRLEESRVQLEMAADLAPRRAMAASQLGMTHLYCGQPEVALRWFEQGVGLASDDPQAPLLLSNLATCLVLLGEVDDAIDRLQTAAVGNPHHSMPPLMLAAAFGLKQRPAEASVALQRAVELCPAFATLSYLRNWVARQGGPAFLPIYERTMERGLRQARMAEE